MKKIVIGVFVFYSMSFGGSCLALYNQMPTCSTVASVVSTSMQQMINNFITQRQTLVLEPTSVLNTKVVQLNALNKNVYMEQQAIMNLDNSIAVEMEQQNFLLEKLSKLKEQSIQQQELLLKASENKK